MLISFFLCREKIYNVLLVTQNVIDSYSSLKSAKPYSPISRKILTENCPIRRWEISIALKIQFTFYKSFGSIVTFPAIVLVLSTTASQQYQDLTTELKFRGHFRHISMAGLCYQTAGNFLVKCLHSSFLYPALNLGHLEEGDKGCLIINLGIRMGHNLSFDWGLKLCFVWFYPPFSYLWKQ